MTGSSATYIVKVADLSPTVAMQFLAVKQAELDRCKPGWGFGYGLNGRRVFCRRTKTGYSIVQLKKQVRREIGPCADEPRLSA